MQGSLPLPPLSSFLRGIGGYIVATEDFLKFPVKIMYSVWSYNYVSFREAIKFFQQTKHRRLLSAGSTGGQSTLGCCLAKSHSVIRTTKLSWVCNCCFASLRQLCCANERRRHTRQRSRVNCQRRLAAERHRYAAVPGRKGTSPVRRFPFGFSALVFAKCRVPTDNPKALAENLPEDADSGSFHSKRHLTSP